MKLKYNYDCEVFEVPFSEEQPKKLMVPAQKSATARVVLMKF